MSHAAYTANVFRQARTRAREIKAVEHDPARSDFLEFRRRVMRDDVGNPLVEDDYSRIWATTLDHCYERRIHVNHKSPPQLGKSTDVRGYAAYRVGRNPAITIGCIAADASASVDACSLMRSIVLSEPFQAIFPEAVPDYDRSLTEPKKRRGGQRQDVRDSRGWRQDGWFLQAAGQRKDPTCGAYAAEPKREDLSIRILIADDLITERIANSTAERLRIERAFANTWIEGRISKAGGWAVHIQNNRLRGDLGDQLRFDARWCSIYVGVTLECDRMFLRLWNAPEDLPILADPAAFNLERVDPEDGADHQFEFPLPAGRTVTYEVEGGRTATANAWTPEALMARKESSRRQLFHLIGLAADDLMFPAWVERDARPTSVAGLLHLRMENDLPVMDVNDRRRLPVIMAGLDLSSRKRRGVFATIWCRDVNWRKYPLAVYSTGSAEHAIDFFQSCWENGIHFQELIVENNALQDQIIAMARNIARQRGLPWQHRIKEFTTGSNKLKEEDGLPAINSLIAGREIVFPELEAAGNPTYGKHWKQLWADFRECPRFPEPNRTPDGVMSSWFAIRRIEESPRGTGCIIATGTNGTTQTIMGKVPAGRFDI